MRQDSGGALLARGAGVSGIALVTLWIYCGLWIIGGLWADFRSALAGFRWVRGLPGPSPFLGAGLFYLQAWVPLAAVERASGPSFGPTWLPLVLVLFHLLLNGWWYVLAFVHWRLT